MSKAFQSFNDGKWALILGSSSGFGEAAALKLAESGLNIFGVHMDRKAGQAHADEIQTKIKAMGRQVVFFNMNAADEEKRHEAIAIMKEKGAAGKIHVLMHSLAFGALKPFIETDPSEGSLTKAQFEMTLDVMANSLVYWVQDLVREGLMAKGGRIFAMTSAGSSTVWRSYGAVSAAKASLESYCRQLAVELAPQGITANAILAGVTDTPALRKIPGNTEMIETATARNPFKRLTTPEDVAASIAAFSLPHFDFMTGNTIRIDGGENVVD
jgi:NAD(P)-dependent dehydrogenase (short-subunit alcohol dehydrogenase family)